MDQAQPGAIGGPAAWTRWAAASGFVAVAAGAFAAHGLSDPRAQELMRTGASYQLAHAVAAFAAIISARLGARRAILGAALLLIGSALFSGSLYALAFGAPRWAGAVTPVGGLGLLAGWAALVWAAGEAQARVGGGR
jgi:uncharacterized membrane protein YgdD (TMEM256/DUF423 family)